jgi:hypothetical protein
MIPQPRCDLFPVDGHESDTPNGRVIACVTINPHAVPSTGGFSNQAWFTLQFSNDKELALVLSDAGMHHDPDDIYSAKAFQLVEDWLVHGGPNEVEFYGP